MRRVASVAGFVLLLAMAGCEEGASGSYAVCPTIVNPAVAVAVWGASGGSAVRDPRVDVSVRGISGAAETFEATKAEGAFVPGLVVFGGEFTGEYEVKVVVPAVGYSRTDTVQVVPDVCGSPITVTVEHRVTALVSSAE